jgi:hypothetical protein
MSESRGLVGELMRRKGLGVMRRDGERVLVLKMMSSEGVSIEAMEVVARRGLAGMQAAF